MSVNRVWEKWPDLSLLIQEPYHEGTHLDFKEKIPNKDDRQGWERIFASICAFANSEGGTLIFGVKEVDGIAKEICPFPVNDFESIRLQFIEKIRLYIVPKPTITFFRILNEEKGSEGCLILQIPQSFGGPHMLSNHANLSPNRQSRFYKRVESQNYVMDHKEIGEQFMLSEKWEEAARRCFHERKEPLKAKEYPVNFDEMPYAFFYLTPLGRRTESIAFTEEFLQAFRLPSSENLGFYYDRPTFEGHLFYNYIPNNNPVITTKMLNIIYNGTIEIIFGKNTTTIEHNGSSYIQEGVMEREIVKLCHKLLKIYNKFIEFSPPFGVFYNLIGVRDRRLRAYQPFFEEHSKQQEAEMRGTNIQISRDDLLSEAYIEQELTTEKIIGDALKPLFDRVWRAIGQVQSLNYDSNGAWRENVT